jgi:hypothetical protein
MSKPYNQNVKVKLKQLHAEPHVVVNNIWRGKSSFKVCKMTKRMRNHILMSGLVSIDGGVVSLTHDGVKMITPRDRQHMLRTRAEANADRTREFRSRMVEQGFMQKQLWVHKDDEARYKEFKRSLRVADANN